MDFPGKDWSSRSRSTVLRGILPLAFLLLFVGHSFFLILTSMVRSGTAIWDHKPEYQEPADIPADDNNGLYTSISFILRHDSKKYKASAP